MITPSYNGCTSQTKLGSLHFAPLTIKDANYPEIDAVHHHLGYFLLVFVYCFSREIDDNFDEIQGTRDEL